MKAGNVWKKHCESMRSYLDRDSWNDFTSWPTVRGTMFTSDTPYIRLMYDELLRANHNLWEGILEETSVGLPEHLPYAPKTSGQMVRLAYHLSQWGIDFSGVESIYEFGPGYGVMALLARRLGFVGDYLMHDLLEFEKLQRFYLRDTGIEAAHVGTEQRNVDLFIAVCSLSETPLDVRNEVLSNVVAKSYLFVYGPGIWEGVDNKEFFHDFMESHGDLSWQSYNNPYYTNLWYGIGR